MDEPTWSKVKQVSLLPGFVPSTSSGNGEMCPHHINLSLRFLLSCATVLQHLSREVYLPGEVAQAIMLLKFILEEPISDLGRNAEYHG
jgi:hypothetical protein